MGNKTGSRNKLSKKEMDLLSQQSQLQPMVIQQIYDAFMDRAGKGGRMTINEFKMTYPEINLMGMSYESDPEAENIFMMFDVDRNGVLTFNEFLGAFIVIQRGMIN